MRIMFKNKIWIRFFCAYAILLFAFAVSMTFLWNRHFVNTMQEERRVQFVSIARDANKQIEERISSVKQAVNNSLNTTSVIRLLKNIDSKETELMILQSFENLCASRLDEIRGIMFLNNNGTHVSTGSIYYSGSKSETDLINMFHDIPENASAATYIELTSSSLRLYVPAYNAGKHFGTFIVELDEMVIRNTFSEQESLKNSISFVFNKNSELIFSTNYGSNTLSQNQHNELTKNIKYSGEFYNISPTLGSEKYFGVAYRSSYTGLSNVILTPYSDINNSYFNSPTFKMSVLSSLIFFVLALILCVFLVNGIVKKVENLKKNMIYYTTNIEKPDIYNSDSIVIKDEIDECYVAYTEMLNHIRTQIDNINVLNKQRRILEINALEAQLNPHFLYNTLNTIRFLAEEGKTEAVSKLSIALIDLLQFTLRNKTPYVTVQEEIIYIQNYISINTQNSEAPLEVQYLIPEYLLEYRIPKMILQPILENCFKHGLCGNENDLIVIKATIEKNELEFKVIDNGKGISPEQLKKLSHLLNSPDIPSDKIGLCNINKRLKVMYGEKYGLSIFSIENMQTIVTVRLPITDDKGEL